MKKNRRKYDREFKEGAVRLVVEEGKTSMSVERDLGLGQGVLSRWVREYKEDPTHSFPGKGRLKPEDEQFRRLKRDNEILKQERDILKKALAIFSTNRK